MNDILKSEIFEVVKAHTATIEFQKRGLPHAHILLILDNASKPTTPEMIDRIVCAKIPDEVLNPRLHSIITSQNIHGPCGNINSKCPCMSLKQCTKQFPKKYQSVTKVTEATYPLYPRRNVYEGDRIHIKIVKGEAFSIDN